MNKIKFLFIALLSVLLSAGCGNEATPDLPPEEEEKPIEYPIPTDPEVASTMGFFMDGWKAKSFIIPSFTEISKPATSPSVTIDVDASKIITKIPQTMFGQNSVSYVQNLSTEEPLMTYLKDLNVGLIRFPGGSISDTYFWNGTFNNKPDDAPEYLYDGDKEELWRWNYWYGKNNPTNQRANLDDYYALLQKTGSEGVITVNYGYARYGLSEDPVAKAAHLAAEWVRYDNGRTKYWEIGNENHGSWEKGYRINTANNKDGQPEYLTGQLYAKHAKVFMDSMRNAAKEIGKEIKIGVGVVEEYNSWLWESSKAVPQWNSSIMTEMKSNGADFYIIHSYYINNSDNTFEKIIASAEKKTGEMIKYVTNDMTKNGLSTHPIALTEYNIFAVGPAGSMQQVSYVNGMHTTIVLCESIKNNMGATARWDIANGWDNGADHGMFNLGDEPNAEKWNPRPVFYYMYYLQKMMGDRMIASTSSNGNILSYASSFTSGEKGVVLINKSNKQEIVKINIKNANVGKRAYWYTLTGGSDNGDFSRKVLVNSIGPEGQAMGGPARNYKTLKANSLSTDNGIIITLPPRAVTFLAVDK